MLSFEDPYAKETSCTSAGSVSFTKIPVTPPPIVTAAEDTLMEVARSDILVMTSLLTDGRIFKPCSCGINLLISKKTTKQSSV